MSAALTLNGEGFRPAHLDFGWRPELITVSGAVFEAVDGGRLSVPAAAWVSGTPLPDRPLEVLNHVVGTVEVQNLSLGVAQRMLRESPRGSDRGAEAADDFERRHGHERNEELLGAKTQLIQHVARNGGSDAQKHDIRALDDLLVAGCDAHP